MCYWTPDGIPVTPKTFLTDLGSTPRITWSLFPPDEYAPAYVIHDWLCETGKSDIGTMRRKTIDQCLYHAVILVGDHAIDIDKRKEAKAWRNKLAFVGLRKLKVRAKATVIYRAVRFAAILRGKK